MKTICIIGLGYVGLPLACICAKKGFKVNAVDIDQNKLNLISKGISPIENKKIEKDLKEQYTNFQLYSSTYEGMKNSDIIIICVPTPITDNKQPDLKPMELALIEISKSLSKNQIVIIESTIYPGLTEEFAKPILEKSGLKEGKDFYLVHCPERINPGDKKWRMENIPRVVGGLSEKGTKLAAEFYRQILDAEIMELSSVKEAEATKILENTFRDINIAFINELAKSFDVMGINIYEVIKGASTKPFAFIPHYPGPGVGGHCIPVDPYYLIEKARENGFEHNFLMLARKINESMPTYVAGKAIQALRELQLVPEKSKVTILGLAYKKNIDDTRESPAFRIISELKAKGVDVKTFDPHVESSDFKDLDSAIKDTDCIILVTEHDEFRELSPEKMKKYKIRAIVDTRKMFDRKEFEKARIIYKGLGF